ncbi:MAG: UDP-N-acetylmuramoyl-L-alanyl-D-glutamate--2,6-diaminopimelate ligase [Candidatus Eremiobacteraeota bacterium]|nr:UDP-N-acetylmuramoyl-L-alanyl-D-glutamate--2,6-diaminopimelate ligase [Candidatus Eremiobacteraeota bacterium]
MVMSSVITEPLEHLFTGVPARIVGDPRTPITSLTTDSRAVKRGALFFCLRGEHVDGHEFAATAVAAGAAAVAAEHPLALPPDIPIVLVPDTLAALSKAAARLYHDPSQALTMVGVTGTNGKTTTTFFIEAIARAAGHTFGVVGTLGARLGAQAALPLANTTPFAHDLQRLLAGFRDTGAQGAVLEASSHALALHRLDDVHFDVAVLTNLTQDHLDFHKNFEDYRDTKRRLFSRQAGKDQAPVAVLNVDDAEGRALASSVPRRLTYGVENPEALLRATGVSLHAGGARFSVGSIRPAPFVIQLPGAFNVANAMAAIGAACALDYDVEAIAEGLASLREVPGRMVSIPAGDVGIFIDYAHTPDGLENALHTVRGLTSGRLICVFGCGGNRDASKRPAMGRIAQAIADHVILTTDNPRHEDPRAIIDDILAGMDSTGSIDRIDDRLSAITRAIQQARPGDCVLIAGKGHEEYQLFGDERRPFSDAQAARAALEQVAR